MIVPGNITGTLTEADSVVGGNIEDADHVIVQVTGTWVGTITPEISVNGTDYVAQAIKSSTQVNATTLITSFTTNGISSTSTIGVPWFRLRMSSYTSGTATVEIHADRIAK
jgi:hypothetical protein